MHNYIIYQIELHALASGVDKGKGGTGKGRPAPGVTILGWLHLWYQSNKKENNYYI